MKEAFVQAWKKIKENWYASVPDSDVSEDDDKAAK